LLVGALRENGCLGEDGVLQARPLAEFLCQLWTAPPPAETSLLWTCRRTGPR
jgi:hypothetical protein